MGLINIRTIRNVLVLMPDKHMGNLVVSLPAIKALKEFFYGKDSYLIVDSLYKDIINAVDGLDNLLLFPRRELNELGFSGRFSLFSKFFKQLRGITPDIAIDLQGGNASSMFTFLSGARIRVGKATSEKPYVYNIKVKLSKGRHKLFSYKEVAEVTGASVDSKYPVLSPQDGVVKSLRERLRKEGISQDKPIICIHPSAGKIYKQWRVEGFSEISDWLSSAGYNVVYVGSGHDLLVIEKIQSISRGISCNLCGMLSLGELMALFRTCSLYIGNDSGPMHLAAATNVPVIALFGPADEKRWGPLSENSIVLRGDEPCHKCKGKDCELNFRCIKNLSTEVVKSTVEEVLRKEKMRG